MYIAVRRELNGTIYFDKNYFNRHSDLKYGFSKIYVPDEYLDDICESDFNNDLTFSIEKYNQRKSKIVVEEELANLKAWFDTYYAQHEQKYRRLHTLAIDCDDGVKPYTKLMSLYEEAEEKRTRIQELEKLI